MKPLWYFFHLKGWSACGVVQRPTEIQHRCASSFLLGRQNSMWPTLCLPGTMLLTRMRCCLCPRLSARAEICRPREPLALVWDVSRCCGVGKGGGPHSGLHRGTCPHVSTEQRLLVCRGWLRASERGVRASCVHFMLAGWDLTGLSLALGHHQIMPGHVGCWQPPLEMSSYGHEREVSC